MSGIHVYEPEAGGSGVSAHGDLTGVSADQHHAQLHAAAHAPGQPDSIDGTYATDAALAAHLATENADHGLEHADLNLVGANDHHNQAHAIGGADHSGFPGGTATFLRADGTFGSNLYVRQTDPGMAAPGIWVETDGVGNVVTFWIETVGV